MNDNPWKTVWTEPRATISAVVAQNPDRCLWWLAAIYGFSSVLNMSQTLLLGYRIHWAGVVLLAIVLGPLVGFLNFTVWSWVVHFTGKWLRGVGTFKAVRAAYSWSMVPMIVNIPLWLALIGIFGQRLFMEFNETMMLTDLQVGFLFGVFLIRIATAVWSIVIYLNGLAQVQQFTILRAIGNVLIAALLLAVVSYGLLVLFFGAAGSTAPAAMFCHNNSQRMPIH
jgi:hypothetical protein